MVAGEGLAAVGADLLVVRGRGWSISRAHDISQIFIGEIGVKIGIECCGALRKHDPEISMVKGLGFQLYTELRPSILHRSMGR